MVSEQVQKAIIGINVSPQSVEAFFPFSLGENLGYVLSLSDAFDVRADSAGTRIVGLKDR